MTWHITMATFNGQSRDICLRTGVGGGGGGGGWGGGVVGKGTQCLFQSVTLSGGVEAMVPLNTLQHTRGNSDFTLHIF